MGGVILVAVAIIAVFVVRLSKVLTRGYYRTFEYPIAEYIAKGGERLKQDDFLKLIDDSLIHRESGVSPAHAKPEFKYPVKNQVLIYASQIEVSGCWLSDNLKGKAKFYTYDTRNSKVTKYGTHKFEILGPKVFFKVIPPPPQYY